MKENKFFPWVVAIAAASISFSAAFYSIFGIGKMFAGAANNVMVMAASLEFAKLVIASFLYRFWDDVNKTLRTYLAVACVILIMITSAGIYGFLSSAYQETANKVENVDKNTAVISKKKEMIQTQLTQAEKQLEMKSTRQNTLSDMRNRQQTNADNLIAQNKSASSVRSQMNSLGAESKALDNDIKVLQDTIASKTQQINALDMEILDKSSNNELANEIGPLKYLAKITGKSLDQVVNWFIIALMLVFDPLAIALVVAANFVFEYVANKRKEEEEERKKNAKNTEEDPKEKIEENKFIIGEAPIPPAIVEEPAIQEEDIKQILEDPYFMDDYAMEEVPEILEEPVVEVIETVTEEQPVEEEREEVLEKEPVIEEQPVEEEIEEHVTEEQPIEEEEIEETVEEPIVEETAAETVEDADVPQEPREDGEFGGYRLGNVYNNEPKPRRQVFDEEQHVHQIDHPASSNPTILN
jgi:hypothetical protein